MTKRRWLLITALAFGALVVTAGVVVARGPGSPSGAPLAQSALGTGFTYQGRLDEGGNPADGAFDLRFILFDTDVGGAQVGGTVALEDVGVDNGLFSVRLDFGDGAFTGDARWLEVAVRPGASTVAHTIMSPRQPLTPTPYALALPGLYTQPNETSPNIIGGWSGNFVSPGVVGGTISGGGAPVDAPPIPVFPDANQITDSYGTVGGGAKNLAGNGGTTEDATYATGGGGSTVSGGLNNQANGANSTAAGGAANRANAGGSTVGGGQKNTASGIESTVPGGRENTANNEYSTVGGGLGNTAGGNSSTVAGGEANTASGERSTVGGGIANTASNLDDTVGGGQGNVASGGWATVGGGLLNQANGTRATIPGGDRNTADGHYSLAAGRRANADHEGSFVWADSNDFDFNSTTTNEFAVRATGGVRFVTGIDGITGTPTTGMRIAPNGNIGVGTTNPSTTLDVVGTASISGEVDMPAMDVSFFAFNTASDTVGRGWNKVEFDFERHDDGAAYDNVNDRFVAPATGAYHFDAQVMFNSIPAGTRVAIALRLNGAGVDHVWLADRSAGGSVFSAFGGSAVVKLDAGDTIDVWALADVASPTHFGMTNNTFTRFSGHRLY